MLVGATEHDLLERLSKIYNRYVIQLWLTFAHRPETTVNYHIYIT